MALNLTSDQRTLLRSGNIKVRLLTTWYMDGGTYRFCEDVDDITIGADTWIGAAAVASASEFKGSATGMAAEPVKLIIDGTRMLQMGFTDPAAFFRTILSEPLSNRLVDLELAVGYADSDAYILVVPLHAGKINSARLVDPSTPLDAEEPAQPNLEVVLDSLAMRYAWVTNRVRSHQDQLEIDPTDNFFSHTHNNVRNEQLLYWGKKRPVGAGSGGGGYGGGGLGGGGGYTDFVRRSIQSV